VIPSPKAGRRQTKCPLERKTSWTAPTLPYASKCSLCGTWTCLSRYPTRVEPPEGVLLSGDHQMYLSLIQQQLRDAFTSTWLWCRNGRIRWRCYSAACMGGMRSTSIHAAGAADICGSSGTILVRCRPSICGWRCDVWNRIRAVRGWPQWRNTIAGRVVECGGAFGRQRRESVGEKSFRTKNQ